MDHRKSPDPHNKQRPLRGFVERALGMCIRGTRLGSPVRGRDLEPDAKQRHTRTHMPTKSNGIKARLLTASQEAVELVKRGLSQTDAAAILGITQQSVSDEYRRQGYHGPTPGGLATRSAERVEAWRRWREVRGRIGKRAGK